MKVDPDDLEEAGDVHLKALANSYDDLVTQVARATQDRATAFTCPKAPSQSTALLDAFDDAYEMYYTVIYRTAVNIRAMGEALVDFAENHRSTDADVEKSFEDYEETIRDGRSKGYSASHRPPPKPEDKDTFTHSAGHYPER